MDSSRRLRLDRALSFMSGRSHLETAGKRPTPWIRDAKF